MKEESEKAGLKLNIPKTKIMASGPITSWQIDEVREISDLTIANGLLKAKYIEEVKADAVRILFS